MADVQEDDILQTRYPAKQHAKRVADDMMTKGATKDAILYLESQKSKLNEDSDQDAHFRQRRHFYYLSGCELADCYVAYNIAAEKLTLFLPPINPDDVVWSGLPLSLQEALDKYDIDDCQYSDQLNAFLAAPDQPANIYAIANQVSGHISFLGFDSQDFGLLKPAIDDCRVVKSEYEIALIKRANHVSTAAHVATMKQAKNARDEQELEAIFLKTCIERGCHEQAYHSIVASGTSAATLHYVKNNAPLQGKLNILLDAGAEMDCYASDITRTFPINGQFSAESRQIYDIVLQMQTECIDMIKEDVLWDDIHAHAHRVAIRGLIKLGIFLADEETIFQNRASVAFFPHGLGHFLGMDTHDTGGQPNYSDTDSMFRYLRVRRTLPAGSIITVEPGIYFCRFIIDPALQNPALAKLIDAQVLDRYWQVGGIRIEDNILVTKTGSVNITPTPKTVAELQRLVSESEK